MPRDQKPGDAGATPLLTEDELREQPMSDEGAVVKEDLVEAIAEADVILDDGRPPLHDVAQAAAERDAENALELREPSDQ